MLEIGCHLSAAGGYEAMARAAVAIGANTFQFFTRNPRGGAVRALDAQDIAAFHAYASTHGIRRILAHAPYTLNPCAADPHTLDFALRVLREDLERMEQTPHQCYNIHPGYHVGQGREAGIQKICDTLNAVLTEEQTTTVLLETMAGKGSEIGGQLADLRAIIDGVHLSAHVGVCLDTCHMSDAGYDIAGDFERVLDEVEQTVGLDRVRAVHLNDSMNPPGSRKDRHQKIGEGELGLSALVRVINTPRLRGIPFYLETPNEPDGYAAEIKLLRAQYTGA